jgi:hypothetical protein
MQPIEKQVILTYKFVGFFRDDRVIRVVEKSQPVAPK